MKFDPMSSSSVNHGSLPSEVTDEEREILEYGGSSFILGRSGTGKTTTLTKKLCQTYQQFYNVASQDTTKIEIIADEVEVDVDGNGGSEAPVLHQLFVTASPMLCNAVKKVVAKMKRIATSNFTDIDKVEEDSEFEDIPDTFVSIEKENYPLIITFHKFLMMLDGSLGESYFQRFSCVRDEGRRSVALQTFFRNNEVTYDRFSSTYWPHFSKNLTKNLDASRVFIEIMSHIKGGRLEGEAYDCKLSREEYILLSKNRISTLNEEQRGAVYDIFEHYERLKLARGNFDVADFVSDIHLRIKKEDPPGDKMDFVYVDEVQDLTMSQISLLKYISKNNEGFTFSGDTAQTISRGADFRFEDIKSLFYKEFLGSSSRKKEIKMFKLSKNFRTHSGVLRLANSIIDLLYHYFPNSIDHLPEDTSLIDGESAIFLEEDISTIFNNQKSFGADQVILVRDDSVKEEVYAYIGDRALILTILECKGLEFQDVLLYNFFGSSPLLNKWRVVYGFMKEIGTLDDACAFQTFNNSKHNLLCFELKQMYVALTRTRQRLWICEKNKELSKPMLDYWKKSSIVEVTKHVDSMYRVSSREEWRSRAMQFIGENNSKMAQFCFEKAGEEKLDDEIELLQQSNHFSQAASLLFSSIVSTALWGKGNNGWPFKSFPLEQLDRLKSIGEKDSDPLCSQMVKFLECNQQKVFSKLMTYVESSKDDITPIGEVIVVRRLLEDKCKYRSNTFVEELIGLWDTWKKRSIEIIDCLHMFPINPKMEGVVGFCIYYFGLRLLDDSSFQLLNVDAVWTKRVKGLIQRRGNVATIEVGHFANAAQKFWLQQLLDVGLQVLDTFKRLHMFSVQNGFLDPYARSLCLVRMYDIAKLLLHRCNDNMKKRVENKLQEDFEQSRIEYYSIVFSVNPQASLSEKMIYLRGTEISMTLIEEWVSQLIGGSGAISIEQIGDVVMSVLGNGNSKSGFYGKVVDRLPDNQTWKSLVKTIRDIFESDFENYRVIETPLRKALCSNVWIEGISPLSTLYLLERLIILPPHLDKYFYTAKSSMVEFLVCVPERANPRMDNYREFDVSTLKIFARLVFTQGDQILRGIGTANWFEKYNMNFDNVFVLRLIKVLCILSINYSWDFNMRILTPRIKSKLPKVFYQALIGSNSFVSAVATAFKAIGDPLVIVVSDVEKIPVPNPDTLFLDFTSCSSKGEILKILFPKSKDLMRHMEIIWDLIDCENLDVLRIKVQLQEQLRLVTSAITGLSGQKFLWGDKDLPCDAKGLIGDLNTLLSLISSSEYYHPEVMAKICELCKSMKARKPRIDALLESFLKEKNGPNAVAVSKKKDDEKNFDSKLDGEESQAEVVKVEPNNPSNNKNKKKGKSKQKKGKGGKK